jgi:hypothetical protein
LNKLNSYNFGIGSDFDYTTVELLNNLLSGSKLFLLAGLFEQNFNAIKQMSLASESPSGAIVSTKPFCLVTTNLERSSCMFEGLNRCLNKTVTIKVKQSQLKNLRQVVF